MIETIANVSMRKIKILFLDDMAERHLQFSNWYDMLADVTHVLNYEQAIASMEKQFYDVAFLDHDLSLDDIMCIPGERTKEKTGSDVVFYIVNNLPKNMIPKDIIVHSYNPVGVKSMMSILLGADVRTHYIPFSDIPANFQIKKIGSN